MTITPRASVGMHATTTRDTVIVLPYLDGTDAHHGVEDALPGCATCPGPYPDRTARVARVRTRVAPMSWPLWTRVRASCIQIVVNGHLWELDAGADPEAQAPSDAAFTSTAARDPRAPSSHSRWGALPPLLVCSRRSGMSLARSGEPVDDPLHRLVELAVVKRFEGRDESWVEHVVVRQP